MSVEDILDFIYDRGIYAVNLRVWLIDDYPVYYEITKKHAAQLVSVLRNDVVINAKVDGGILYLG